MLPLHGATVTTEEDDPEGDLLATLRDIVGPDDPDRRDVRYPRPRHGADGPRADALIGFKTQPHVDHYETATARMEHPDPGDARRDAAR